MAYTMTYDSLLADLRRYLEGGFTSDSDPLVYTQLPRIINNAERRCALELKIQGFVQAVTTTLVVGQAIYEKPDRWRDTINVTVDNQPIFARSYDYCRSYWPDPSETGTPQFYADYDYTHWLIVPTPATASTMEVLYYELPQLLDSDHQSNWLTNYAPTLLLYACLLEAAPFMKNDVRIPMWQTMYDRVAQSITGEDLERILDRASKRSEP